jgi:hypothetical protein
MLGDVQINIAVCNAARNYAMDSGFYLIGQFNEVCAVVLKLGN